MVMGAPQCEVLVLSMMSPLWEEQKLEARHTTFRLVNKRRRITAQIVSQRPGAEQGVTFRTLSMCFYKRNIQSAGWHPAH